ncbi:MAG TPA: tRNA (N6-threonylcarbamoyladenosine(37)-N6)-methyltransferase TrmO [Pseudonocardia sp.]|uniref:tRNA (N6-threonylcarbamoyladenosine(37)-N6)-methyltransferase TrmO n=1 Tax=Pseudonocardia sp. TaxID=60912 RepID=UPI002B4B4BE8|nr:tRNA (N6-threonylcarbamoyladenosine(37)-N6)-methyltransferase TrmO [Pseudonocardia sp.]HLU60074.1 tRNA (N6-threonylcarbamoyladenosine(37)-N6)-methyltransferase TrmO [Pseudonocardia sp.]
MQLRPIGRVRSPLTDPAAAPKQADEGAPPARIEVRPEYAEAVDGLAAGEGVVVLTWLHRADRSVLAVHPRGDPARPLTGVFATRSQDRPNPVGLHVVTITAIEGTTIEVDALEAVDGTPVIDIKPVLGPER